MSGYFGGLSRTRWRMRERVDVKSPVRGKPPAGICEGGAGQPVSLPRQNLLLVIGGPSSIAAAEDHGYDASATVDPVGRIFQ